MKSDELTNLLQTDHSPTQRRHGSEPIRGVEDVPHSTLYEGHFGRMFSNLPSFAPADEDLVALAATMQQALHAKERTESGEGGKQSIPAGFTYLGQFVDHDITFDANSKLQRKNNPKDLPNLRTPRFDLDSMYGKGPVEQSALYADGVKFLIGQNVAGQDDLPRDDQGLALLGDSRNDENLITSQLHLAFLKYHNRVVDAIRPHIPADQLFEQARRIVRWHYQWVVVHDFLKRIVGGAVLNDVLKQEKFVISEKPDAKAAMFPKADLKFYRYKNEPFIPVEFSGAAYRFGHSMVRAKYDLNATARGIPIFALEAGTEDLHGSRPRPPELEIEWFRFFEFPGYEEKVQPARKIDTLLSPGLAILPASITGPLPNTPIGPKFKSLAVRNLLRGKALGLPSGQAVARAMGIPEEWMLHGEQLGLKSRLLAKFGDDTPLWFYILKEAQLFGQGEKLGPVGGRIVAEVLIGLLQGDPQAYLNVAPNWQPVPGEFGARPTGEAFGMADLLQYATTSESTVPLIVHSKKEAEMSVMFIGRYNGEFSNFNQEIQDAAAKAAVKLFGMMMDGMVTDDPNPDITFKYVDSFRQIQPPGGNVQATTKGFGWIAVIPDSQFTTMLQALNYPAGPLCQMYNIEIISLNNSNESPNPTQDVYARMTTVFNWGHGGGG